MVACKTESDLSNSKRFNHKSPLYQSAIIPCNSKSGDSIQDADDGEESCTGETTETSESMGENSKKGRIIILY